MKLLDGGKSFDARQTKKGKTYLRDICLLLKNCRFHLVAPYINAFVVVFGFLSASNLKTPHLIDTALVFLFSAIHTGAIYSLNNVYDVDADKTQLLTADDFGRWNLSVKNQVACGNVSKEKASIFSVTLFCSSALYFYLAGGLLPALFATIIFSWGWAYSAPPVRLKNRFLLDLALHGLFWGGFLFLMGFSMKNTGSLHAVLPLLILIFLASVLWEFHNHFEDYYADKEAGKMTSVVRLGLRRSFYVYVLLLGIAIACSIFLIPMMWSTVAFLAAMIVYLTSILKVAKDNSFGTLFLPRKHFYLANSLLLLWITMSVYFQWIF